MFTRSIRAFAAFCLAATLAYSADTVELLPGKITGSINLSSEAVQSGSVSASAIDGSGSASSSFSGNTFSIVVAAGKTWRLNFSLNTGNNAQITIYTTENIAVGANQTVTQDYSIATARVTADVQVSNGSLTSFGYLQAGGNDGTVSFSSYSYSSGVVTVLPFSSVSVYGTASLQSSTGQTSSVALATQSINVPLGGATATWNVNAAFVSSTVQGALQLNGGPAITSSQIYVQGQNNYYYTQLNGNGTFQFDNVQAGYYSAYAYVNFANSSLYLYRSFDLAAGSVATVNYHHDLATAKVGLELSGFVTTSSNLSAYLYTHGPDSSSGNATLDSSGSFLPVVTAGAWSFSQINLSGYESGGYFSIYKYDATRTATTFAAGDNLTVPAYTVNTTETEFTFDVVEAPGATSETLISYPNVYGYSSTYSPSGQYLGQVSISAQNYSAAQARPRLRIVGEPGTYYVQAYANVDGSNVSFGNFTLELKAPLPTPVGTNVTVQPGAGVTLQFDQVTTAGVTTVSQLPVGPALPGGYSNLLSDGAKIYYSGSTTATFAGYIDVTVGFAPNSVAAELEAGLHLFYYDKATETWIDITTSVDQVNNVVTGTAPGLSTFALGLPHAPVIGTIAVPLGGAADTPLTFSATFSDVDPGEQHTAVWSWGNGSGNSAGVVNQSNGTITAERAFTNGGTYQGTLTVTDITGNVATKAFTFTIVGNSDTVAPVITTAGHLTVEATSASGAAVSFSVSATDDKDGNVAVATSAASGSTFALGTTTVTATATDAAGNVAQASFTVTVVDTIAPVITAPASLVFEATSAAGAAATFAVSATDATGATVTSSHASGATFAVGTTTVTATATDAVGNQSTATFTVTVRDTVAPAISSVTTSVASLWPANHKMVAVTVSAVATDLVGPVSYRIASVTSSEPDNGLGDGDTANDIEITGAMTVNLRAERAGNGSGRTYTITVEARDAAGNTSTKTVAVGVPKSQGK